MLMLLKCFFFLPLFASDYVKIRKISEQVDPVISQAIWVVTGEKPRTAFALLAKAARKLGQEKALHAAGLFSQCEQYEAVRNGSEIHFYFNCLKKKKEWAVVSINNSSTYNISFDPQELTDIFGLGPSLLGNKSSCLVRLDLKDAVSDVNCSFWSQEVQGKIYNFEQLKYSRDGLITLSLKGSIKENLVLTRTFTATVPKSGKIFSVQKEVKKLTADGLPQPIPPTVAKPAPVRFEQPAHPEIPTDPDLIRMQRGQFNRPVRPLPPTAPKNQALPQNLNEQEQKNLDENQNLDEPPPEIPNTGR